MSRLALLLVLAACEKAEKLEPDKRAIPFRARLEAVRPDVEAVIGRPLGRRVEIFLTTNEDFAPLAAREAERRLARIEAGRRGDELAEYCASGGRRHLAAVVGRRARVYVLPAAFQGWKLGGFLPMKTPAWMRAPEYLDLVLAHELAHVHQVRHLRLDAFHGQPRTLSDVWAREAVSEGHAEYVQHEVAVRRGLRAESLVSRWKPNPKAPPPTRDERVSALDTSYEYDEGQKFVRAVVERLGYDTAVRRLFRRPSPTLLQIARPATYPGKSWRPRFDPQAQRLRRVVALDHADVDCHPLTPQALAILLGRPADGFLEGHVVSMDTFRNWIRFARFDSEKAATAAERAWIEAAKREDEKLRERLDPFERLLDVRYESGDAGWVARRTLRFGIITMREEHECIRRVGRDVVEVKLADPVDPADGVARAVRLALAAYTDEEWPTERTPLPRVYWALRLHDDPDVRRAAVVELQQRGKLDAERPLPPYIEWSASVRDRWRDRAIEDEDWLVRISAWGTLAADTTRSTLERSAALTHAMNNLDPRAFGWACRAAERLNLKEHVPQLALRPGFQHKDAAVRREAYRALDWNFKFPIEELAPLLERGMADEDAFVRVLAADKLHLVWDIDSARGAEVLMKGLRSDDFMVRVRASREPMDEPFEMENADELIAAFIPLLEEQEWRLAYKVADILGAQGERAAGAVRRLRRLLLRDQFEVRVAAARALFRIAGDAQPMLDVADEFLGSEESDQRCETAESLTVLGPEAAPFVARLIEALGDSEASVRKAAAEALGAIGDPIALPALDALSDDEEKYVREAALAAWGEIHD
ncbi:MAG: HEAT repeat domain-containing protein [Planctomycetota bacterium]